MCVEVLPGVKTLFLVFLRELSLPLTFRPAIFFGLTKL
jgi:hypothetical protein